MFTNGSGTSVDKNTTYYFITDKKPPVTEDISDTSEEYIDDEQFISILSEYRSSIVEGARMPKNRGIFVPNSCVRHITFTPGELSNHHKKPPVTEDISDTSEEYIDNEQFFSILSEYRSSIVEGARMPKYRGIFVPNSFVPHITFTPGELSNHHEKPPDATDKKDTCESEFQENRLFSSVTTCCKSCLEPIPQQINYSYVIVALIVIFLGTLLSKLTNQERKEASQHCTTSKGTQTTLREDDLDEDSNKKIVGATSHSLELESEKNNVDKFCHGSEELSIDINTTTSDIQLIAYHNNQLNDNIQIDTGKSNQLNADEDLLNTKTTEITMITKQSIANCVLDETITRIKKILKRIKKQQPCTLKELEFCNSELKIEQLEEFLKEALVCEISKLSIGITEHVTGLIPSICRIASRYKTSKLSLIYADLKKEDIEALLQNLNKNDKFMELDINHNRTIESAGYENVGKIVKRHEVRTLRLADCAISDDDLHKLFLGMGDAKLEVLDISVTNNLTTEGFGCIGKQVAQKRIKMLKLSDTQQNVKTLTAFYKEVASLIKDSEGQQVLVEEIDNSYNSTMEQEAYKVLGSMMKLFGVKKLSLASCGLRKEHLEDFRKKMNSENSIKETGQYTKMKYLNVGGNTSIGNGIVKIAGIVKECQLEELDISECRFSAIEIKDFTKTLGEAELKCLYLGEKRQFDKSYISQVCNLLPHIKETLRLKGTVRNHSRSKLQKKLDTLIESKLEIQLDENVTLVFAPDSKMR